MPSFDIVSKVDLQTLDNAVNVTRKEVENRFDFKGSHVKLELDKKDSKIHLETEGDMQMRQLTDLLLSRGMKQGIEASAFDFSADATPSGKLIKKDVPVRNGLKQEDAKKIVKLIKESGLKVQAQIMDDTVRITGKKIDDLQQVIQFCKGAALEFPMQYINMRS